MADPTTPRNLVEWACAYMRGDLGANEAAAFEERLAHDQQARDALVTAVQWHAGPDAASLHPNPEYRAEVRRRLSPHPVWAWLRRATSWSRSRTAWSLAGATLTVMIALGTWMHSGSRDDLPPIAQEPTQTLPVEGLTAKPPVPDSTADPCSAWPATDHLVKALEEEQARKNKRNVMRPGFPPELPMVP